MWCPDVMFEQGNNERSQRGLNIKNNRWQLPDRRRQKKKLDPLRQQRWTLRGENQRVHVTVCVWFHRHKVLITKALCYGSACSITHQVFLELTGWITFIWYIQASGRGAGMLTDVFQFCHTLLHDCLHSRSLREGITAVWACVCVCVYERESPNWWKCDWVSERQKGERKSGEYRDIVYQK